MSQPKTAVRPDRFWKWPRDQYEPFMRQLHRSIYKPPEPLIPIPSPQVEVDQRMAGHFAATWTWVIENPAFQPLKDDANFCRAWLIFQGRRSGSAAWATPKDPGAACRFAYLIALWHGVCSVPGVSAALSPRDAKGSPVRADKMRKQARKRIEGVERDIAVGVIPPDATGKLLAQLLAQTKSSLARRQPKLPARQKDLFAFAAMLVEQLGAVNSKLFMEIATAVGFTCDERTAQRYLKIARGA